MTDISFSDIYFEDGEYKYNNSDIDTYLTNAICGNPKIHAWDYCNNKTSVYDINTCLDTAIKSKETPTIIGSATYNHTAKTTKNDFVALYNEQYTSTVELFIGIVAISLVLLKMLFYPIKN